MREPGYFAIIPANVRYDAELIANAKLLYGEITCLSSKWGYANATNEYFAELYNVSPRTITDWIKKLENKGYIHTEVETKRWEDGTVKKERKIYINHIEVSLQNHVEVSLQNHIEENFAYNNINNIYNNINNIKEENNNTKVLLKEKCKLTPPTLEEIKAYCLERNNDVDAKKFYDYYSANDWKDNKGNPVKSWKQKMIANWEGKGNKTNQPTIRGRHSELRDGQLVWIND